MINQFKELYIRDCINGDGMSEELDKLFEKLLLEEFHDDHTKMDELIAEIITENTPKEPALEDAVKDLQTENAMLKGSVMELSSYLLNRMGGE